MTKRILPYVVAGALTLGSMGCATMRYPKNISQVENILNRAEAEISHNSLKKGEKDFIKIERDFYNALDSGNTDTAEFDSLQTLYHSKKAEREKYQDILRRNINKTLIKQTEENK